MLLTLSIDDILLAGNNLEMIESKKWLSYIFDMKDTGEARYVVGVKIV